MGIFWLFLAICSVVSRHAGKLNLYSYHISLCKPSGTKSDGEVYSRAVGTVTERNNYRASAAWMLFGFSMAMRALYVQL